MEDCDSVKGFQVVMDGDMSFFTGLGTSVLEELGDECKSAAKFSIVVGGGDELLGRYCASDGDGDGRGDYWRSEIEAVRAFRSNLNAGCAALDTSWSHDTAAASAGGRELLGSG